MSVPSDQRFYENMNDVPGDQVQAGDYVRWASPPVGRDEEVGAWVEWYSEEDDPEDPDGYLYFLVEWSDGRDDIRADAKYTLFRPRSVEWFAENVKEWTR